MSYFGSGLVSPTMDIFNKSNLVTLAKFYAANIVVAILISAVIGLIIYIMEMNTVTQIVIVLVVLMGQLGLATLFEYWDGCKKD